MISIVDYGMANLRSVQKGFEHVGASASIISTDAPPSFALRSIPDAICLQKGFSRSGRL